MLLSSSNIFNRPTALHGPKKYMELVNEIPEKVHNQLYDDALSKLIADLDNYQLGGFKPDEDQTWEDIILSTKEISFTEYWSPSNVIITFKDYADDGKLRLKKFTFDLSPYWGNCYEKWTRGGNNVKYDKNIPEDTEIIKYDYLRGKAILRSKLEDIEYEVDFDEINNEDVESAEVKLPNDTFTNLVQLNL